MFHFFKNKEILQDLIPDNHIDIHSHILPGIDDGSKTVEDSLFLSDSLQNFGVSKYITTPHIFSGVWNNTKSIILDTENQLKEDFKTNNHNAIFKAAAEYLLDENFVELCRKKEVLTLKDNYVLVEMSYINPPIQLYDFLFEMQVAGYIPVLAHPERYVFYHNKLDEYKKLKKHGCLFQLNLLSVVGYYGSEVTKTTEYLLQKGKYDFVGSDIHHKNHVKSFSNQINIKDSTGLKETILKNQFFTF